MCSYSGQMILHVFGGLLVHSGWESSICFPRFQYFLGVAFADHVWKHSEVVEEQTRSLWFSLVKACSLAECCFVFKIELSAVWEYSALGNMAWKGLCYEYGVYSGKHAAWKGGRAS